MTQPSQSNVIAIIHRILCQKNFSNIKEVKELCAFKKGIPLAEKPLEKDSNQRKLKLKQKSQDTEDDKYKKK